MSTGDWDLFLGPLEWARAETGGADRWVLQHRGFPGVARVYSPPCPWDTHYQFSMKILLSTELKILNFVQVEKKIIPKYSSQSFAYTRERICITRV